MSNLNPDQFSWDPETPKEAPYAGQPLFHGTVHNAEVGDKILPSAHTGVDPVFSVSQPDRAYASEDEMVSWSFATMARANRANNGRGYNHSREGRMRVYDVTPKPFEDVKVGEDVDPTPVMGPHHSAKGSWENLEEWTAPHFTVKDAIDVQPGNQGTIPHINWQQFADQKHPAFSVTSSYDGFNHPEDPDDQFTPDPKRVQEAMGTVAARKINEKVAKSQGRLF